MPMLNKFVPEYNPNEANKSYLDLLKENGTSAAVKSALIVMATYFFNKVTQQPDMTNLDIDSTFFLFCIYYSWKPKIIRFFRAHLMGSASRNKSDK